MTSYREPVGYRAALPYRGADETSLTSNGVGEVEASAVLVLAGELDAFGFGLVEADADTYSIFVDGEATLDGEGSVHADAEVYTPSYVSAELSVVGAGELDATATVVHAAGVAVAGVGVVYANARPPVEGSLVSEGTSSVVLDSSGVIDVTLIADAWARLSAVSGGGTGPQTWNAQMTVAGVASVVASTNKLDAGTMTITAHGSFSVSYLAAWDGNASVSMTADGGSDPARTRFYLANWSLPDWSGPPPQAGPGWELPEYASFYDNILELNHDPARVPTSQALAEITTFPLRDKVNVFVLRWATLPLVAQRIEGASFILQAVASISRSYPNLYGTPWEVVVQSRLTVLAADGTTRAELIPLDPNNYRPEAELIDAGSNDRLARVQPVDAPRDGVNLPAVDVQDGDRLLLEVGFRIHNPVVGVTYISDEASGSRDVVSAELVYGRNSNADVAYGHSVSATYGNPWAELVGYELQFASSTTPPPAQLANDNFADAIELIGASGTAGPFPVTNSATVEVGEPLTGYQWVSAPEDLWEPDGSIWWKWTCPATGRYAFDTYGSREWYVDEPEFWEANTALDVFTGTAVDSLTIVASNDSAVVGGTFLYDDQENYLYYDVMARVEFDAVAGTTYYIRGLSDYIYEAGEYYFTWGLAASLPANDHIRRAVSLPLTGSVSGSTVGATDSSPPWTDGDWDPGGNSSVYYAWSRPYTAVYGDVTFTVTADFPARLDIYEVDSVWPDGQPAETFELIQQVHSGSLTVTLDAAIFTGNNVFLRVSGIAPGDEGTFIIESNYTPGVTDPLTNDNLADADELVGTGGSIPAHNVGATSEASEPVDSFGYVGRTVWWRYVATEHGFVTVTLNDVLGGKILILSVWTEAEEVAAAKADTTVLPGITASVAFEVWPGFVYYVRVGGAQSISSQSTFTLDWEFTLPGASGNLPPADGSSDYTPAVGDRRHGAGVFF